MKENNPLSPSFAWRVCLVTLPVLVSQPPPSISVAHLNTARSQSTIVEYSMWAALRSSATATALLRYTIPGSHLWYSSGSHVYNPCVSTNNAAGRLLGCVECDVVARIHPVMSRRRFGDRLAHVLHSPSDGPSRSDLYLRSWAEYELEIDGEAFPTCPASTSPSFHRQTRSDITRP